MRNILMNIFHSTFFNIDERLSIFMYIEKNRMTKILEAFNYYYFFMCQWFTSLTLINIETSMWNNEVDSLRFF